MSGTRRPRDEIERLLEQLNHSFEEAMLALERGEPLGALEAPLTSWQEGYTWMSVDVLERDDEIVVTADLPGFERDEIDVSVTDSTLVIGAEHEEETEETTEAEAEDERYHRRERRHEGLYRSLRLPKPVVTDEVEATMKRGVLTVRLPTVDEPEGVHIEIRED